MSRPVPPGAGTANIAKTFVAASQDRKSLPTQVHVRPSNINCNSLRADFSLTKFNPTVLIGYEACARRGEAARHARVPCRCPGPLHMQTRRWQSATMTFGLAAATGMSKGCLTR